MLNKDDLMSIVQLAFKPLECVAELKNYNHSFGFAVYLPDESRIRREFENSSTICNEFNLILIIQEVRNKIIEKGIALDSWSFPDK